MPLSLRPFILASYDSQREVDEVWPLRKRFGCWALWMVEEGRGRWVQKNGSVVLLEPGQVLMRVPGIGGSIAIPAGCRFRGITFDVVERQRQMHPRFGWEPVPGSDRQPTPQRLLGGTTTPLLPSELAASAMRLLYQVNARWWRSDADQLVSNLHLAGWLALLADHCLGHAADPVAKAEQFARQALARGVHVSDMAQSVGMPVSTFVDLYKNKRQQSPGHFLRDLRLTTAATMLLQDAPIASIAQAAGFKNAASFARSFKEYYGMSPRSYRQQPRVL